MEHAYEFSEFYLSYTNGKKSTSIEIESTPKPLFAKRNVKHAAKAQIVT